VVATDPKLMVAAGYNAIADRFAAWQEGVRGDARLRYLGELLSRLPPQPDILELGRGAAVPSTSMLASRGRLVGVDISEEQIRRARVRIPEAAFICADATEMDIPPESFDAVVALFVLGHIPQSELAELLARIAMWLRPNGWFLATMGSRGARESIEADWFGVPMFFSSLSADDSRRLVRAVGLEVVKDEVIVQHEPNHGDVEFLWMLAQRQAR
jgi:SAM-dependent methyltransferase